MTPKTSAGQQGLEHAATSRSSSQPAQTSRPAKSEPAETGRYTRPAPKARFRPRWHRVAGWVGVVFGIAIFVANEAMRFSENLTILPFGHSPIYLILALGVGSSSTWFLGMFDRETTVYL